MTDETLILNTVQYISGINYFYSQMDKDCLGALGYTARQFNLHRTDEELKELIPRLREALQQVHQFYGQPK